MTQTYTVESKSTLARLLATENIEIRHGNYSTASFDPKHRVMRLPQWSNVDPDVHDLMIGHEVSHALHTPAEGWHDANSCDDRIPKSFLNVIEDVRIERLIQAKYPGLIGPFQKGYRQLVAQQFFGDYDQKTLNLIDRINIKSKTKDPQIKFTAEELPFYQRAFQTETWDEVVALCREILEFVNEQKDEQNEQQEQEALTDTHESDDSDDNEQSEGTDSNQESTDESGEQDSEDTNSSEQEGSGDSSDDTENENTDQGADESNADAGSDDESENSSNSDDDSGEDHGDSGEETSSDAQESESNAGRDAGNTLENDELEAHTDNEFRKNESRLTEVDNDDTDYVTAAPRKKLLDSVVPAATWLKFITAPQNDWEAEYDAAFLASYQIYMKKQRKLINGMVQKFEMKKQASIARKARVSQTGLLDPLKLHGYKFNEEIFKANTILPTGQSHGIVMYVDLSGSMGGTIGNVIEQILILSEFCRRQQIKFVVYGFKSTFTMWTEERHWRSHLASDENPDRYEDKRIMHKNVMLTEMLSSEMTLKEQLKAASFLLHAYNRRNPFQHLNPEEKNKYYRAMSRALATSNSYKAREYVAADGGTPLNETLIAAHHIVPEFKATHKLDKVSTIVLTDGDGFSLYFTDSHEATYSKTDGYIGSGTAKYLDITIPEVGRRIKCRSSAQETTCGLVQSLIATTDGPVINIHLENDLPNNVSRNSHAAYNLGMDLMQELCNKSKGKGFAVLGAAELAEERRQYNKLEASNSYKYKVKVRNYTQAILIHNRRYNQVYSNHYEDVVPVGQTANQIKKNFIAEKKNKQIKNVVFNSVVEQIATGL